MTSVVGHQAESVYELARDQQPHAVAPGTGHHTVPAPEFTIYIHIHMDGWFC